MDILAIPKPRECFPPYHQLLLAAHQPTFISFMLIPIPSSLAISQILEFAEAVPLLITLAFPGQVADLSALIYSPHPDPMKLLDSFSVLVFEYELHHALAFVLNFLRPSSFLHLWLDYPL